MVVIARVILENLGGAFTCTGLNFGMVMFEISTEPKPFNASYPTQILKFNTPAPTAVEHLV